MIEVIKSVVAVLLLLGRALREQKTADDRVRLAQSVDFYLNAAIETKDTEGLETCIRENYGLKR